MSMRPEQQRLATGEFARRSGLSLKALRLYDENGLLRPAEVDPATGRRGYGPEQLQTARLIGMLRGAGMSLAEISLLLADLTSPQGVKAAERLDHYLDGAEPTGPLTLIFHGIVDHESDGPLEAVLGCPPGTGPTALIGIRTEPARDEAFTTITKAQWDFPAILAAYDAVACSPEVSTAPRSTLSCREVYRADPAAIGPDENVCDIAFPLG